MIDFWADFKDGTAGYVCAESEDAAFKLAGELSHKTVRQVRTLPYPAQPHLNEPTHGCPDFCYSPKQCAGRTACPKSYACSE